MGLGRAGGGRWGENARSSQQLFKTYRYGGLEYTLDLFDFLKIFSRPRARVPTADRRQYDRQESRSKIHESIHLDRIQHGLHSFNTIRLLSACATASHNNTTLILIRMIFQCHLRPSAHMIMTRFGAAL